jgi:hypothetical protein
MKNIVRLTENDLNRLVKKILKEDSELKVNYKDNGTAIIMNGTRKDVSKFLSNLPEDCDAITIWDCEYADFSEVNLCDFKNLEALFFKNTPNNLEEKTPSYCWEKDSYNPPNHTTYSFFVSKEVNYKEVLDIIKSKKSQSYSFIEWNEDKQMFMVSIGNQRYYFK